MELKQKAAWVGFALALVGLASFAAWRYADTNRERAIATALYEADRRANLELSSLTSDIEKFRVLPFVLVELPDVRAALVENQYPARRRLDVIFDALAHQTKASAIYAVDKQGIARSASNADSPDSFVGFDFRFRPYVQRALRAGESEYFAEGAVTGRPGLFLARRSGPVNAPYGLIIVKIEFAKIVGLWQSSKSISFVTNSDGIIIIATRDELQNKTTKPLSLNRIVEINGSRQFNPSLLTPSGLQFDQPGFATDNSGRRYIAVMKNIPSLAWRHYHLEPLEPVLSAADTRSRWVGSFIMLAAVGLFGLLAWVVTRRARLVTAQVVLEQEVQSRTIELSHAYDRLQHEASERDKADGLYRTAREELAQANRLGSIGTITTSVAHEINQPTASIRTAAENSAKLLKRGQYDQAASNLALIISLTQRIGSITRELLFFARRVPDDAVAVRVDEVIEGTMILMQDSFKRANVHLDLNWQRSTARILGSKIRFEQVLVNILQNALDAIEDGSNRTVRFTIKVTKKMALLSIADSGPGIPRELREKVFEPFFTTKARGTGLGLGICKEIVTNYGGTLEVIASNLGGTDVKIMLPVMGAAHP